MPHRIRLPFLLRGVPGRLLAVTLVAMVAFGGWAIWPQARPSVQPPSLALDGKKTDRLAFSMDETEIPVRDSRIFDTLAMFAQPQAQPRAWSEPPVLATVHQAGIQPMAPRAPAPRLARLPEAKAADPARAVRTASAPPVHANPASGQTHLSVLGWEMPGSRHLPTRRDAAQALDRVGGGVATIGSGTVGLVSRTASALGSSIAGAGGAVAETLGLD